MDKPPDWFIKSKELSFVTKEIVSACGDTRLIMLYAQLDRMVNHSGHSRDIAFAKLIECVKIITHYQNPEEME